MAATSLNRLRAMDAEIAADIPDLPRIVAFRNVLVHGYATVDDAVVWEVATKRVAPLIARLTNLLGLA